MNNDLNQNNNQISPMINQQNPQIPPINNSPMSNQSINNQPQKSNKGLIILLIVIIVLLIGAVVYLTFNKKDEPTVNNNSTNVEVQEPTNNPESVQPQENNNVNNNTNNNSAHSKGEITAYYEVEINGHRIGLPATKADFDKVGWEWDPKYANKHLDTDYTSSGGRIGKYPGGVVVSVVNNSGELKKISECPIDLMIFDNPKDGSENIKFIGGIDFNSTLDQVKSTMDRLGFKNPKIYEADKTVIYKYFENNDSINKHDSYIEFQFYDNVFKEVTLQKRIG